MLRQRLLLYVAAMVATVAMISTVIVYKREAATPQMDWISETIDDLHYEVLLPENYRPTGHYPLLLYMHQYVMGNYRNALLKQVEAWFRTPLFVSVIRRSSSFRCSIKPPTVELISAASGQVTPGKMSLSQR